MTPPKNFAIWCIPPFSASQCWSLLVGGRSIVEGAVVKLLDVHHRGRYLLDPHGYSRIPQQEDDRDDDRSTMAIFLGSMVAVTVCLILLSRWSQKASAARELASKKAVEQKWHQHIMRCFDDAQCVMTVSEDVTIEDPSQREVTVDGSRHAFVALPIPRPFFSSSAVAPVQSNNITQPPFLVSNCCGICLEKYKVNDRVVWSPHQQVDSLGQSHDHPITSAPDGCLHAYHQSCILDYIFLSTMKQNGDSSSDDEITIIECPTCRKPFVRLAAFPE